MTLIKPTLDAYAASLNKTWEHDRSQTVGASEIGQCSRKVFWSKNELDPVHRVPRDPDYQETWGARMRGTMFENHFWEPAMRARFGDRLLFAGAEQRTFFNDFLSATPDGLIVDLTPEEQAEIGTSATCVMIEAKTADPRTNLTEAKFENVYQTHVQMGLVREKTKYKPTHSVLSYTDASFWSDVKEFVIAFDQDIYEAAIARALVIMTATSLDEVKPEGWISGGHECRYCPFTFACGIERRRLPFADVEVDPQFASEIYEMAVRYKRLEGTRDVSEADLRELQNEIKTRMREKGVRKIPGVATWTSVKGRKGYDNKAVQAAATPAGVNLEDFEVYGEPTDRLAIQIGSPKTDELISAGDMPSPSSRKPKTENRKQAP